MRHILLEELKEQLKGDKREPVVLPVAGEKGRCQPLYVDALKRLCDCYESIANNLFPVCLRHAVVLHSFFGDAIPELPFALCCTVFHGRSVQPLPRGRKAPVGIVVSFSS